MAKRVSDFTNIFEAGIFLIHSMCRSCSVSGFLFKVMAPCVAILSVCSWEEGNLGASYFAILVDFKNASFKSKHISKGMCVVQELQAM